MKTLTAILLPLCFLGASASGLVKYELKVNEFHELKVVDAIRVVYSSSTDSAGMAVFTCPSEQASALMFNNKGGKLSMQISTESVGSKDLPVVYVYSSYLNKIENSGDSLVKALRIAECPKFTATLIGNGRLSVPDIKATEVEAAIKTGNGTLVIGGKCQKANIKFVGTGVIQADELEAADVSVKAGGTGSIGVWPQKELSVSGVGSTKVYYKGNPEIKNRAAGVKTLPLEQ